jgi:hypothetical protein
MILAYLDLLLNLICKPLSNGCLLFIIPSILFISITFSYEIGCSSIIYIKNRIIGNDITFKEAVKLFQSHLPSM